MTDESQEVIAKVQSYIWGYVGLLSWPHSKSNYSTSFITLIAKYIILDLHWKQKSIDTSSIDAKMQFYPNKVQKET